MKKIIITFVSAFALFIVFAVFACEKAVVSEDNASDLSEGNLHVNVFQIEKTPFASLTRAAVTSICTRINFAVYSTDGTRLKQVNQTSDNASFGTCSFQLEPGTYKLVVVAHSSSGNPTMTNLAKIQFSNSLGFTDTFLCYREVTIGEEAVSLDVSLDRIVSLCRFVITDDIPDDVAQLQFYYTGGSGAFDATTGLGSVNSQQRLTFDASEGQKEFDLYTFLHDTEGTIHLKVTAYDDAENILYERTFDVPMEQNHITWLSGALFNGSGSSSTTITTLNVNTDWAGETHLTF